MVFDMLVVTIYGNFEAYFGNGLTQGADKRGDQGATMLPVDCSVMPGIK
jgi:hypothetical protein